MRLAAVLLTLMSGLLLCAAADPLEGRWQLGNAVIEFVAAKGIDSNLKVVLISSPDLSVVPGTVVGSAQPSPSPGVYDCHLARNAAQAGSGKLVDFAIELSSDANSFTVRPYHRTPLLNFWKMLPYMLRKGIVFDSNRPAGLDGGRRVLPASRPSFLVL